MHQLPVPEFLVGVFDYCLTPECVEAEAVIDDLVTAGVPARDVHLFVPPFGQPGFDGLVPFLGSLGLDGPAAWWCEDHYRAGKVLLVVRPGDRRPEAEAILASQGAWPIYPETAGSLLPGQLAELADQPGSYA